MSRYVDLDGNTWDGTPMSSKIQEVKTKCGYMSGITTGWLWSDSVPHIDIEEHDKQITANAIDELVDAIFDILPNDMNAMIRNAGLVITIADIAERLKEREQ